MRFSLSPGVAAIASLQDELDPILHRAQTSVQEFVETTYKDELLSTVDEIRALLENFHSTNVHDGHPSLPAMEQNVDRNEDQRPFRFSQKYETRASNRVSALSIVTPTPIQSFDFVDGTATPPSKIRRSTFGEMVAQWGDRYRSMSSVRLDGYRPFYDNPVAEDSDDDDPTEFCSLPPEGMESPEIQTEEMEMLERSNKDRNTTESETDAQKDDEAPTGEASLAFESEKEAPSEKVDPSLSNAVSLKEKEPSLEHPKENFQRIELTVVNRTSKSNAETTQERLEVNTVSLTIKEQEFNVERRTESFKDDTHPTDHTELQEVEAETPNRVPPANHTKSLETIAESRNLVSFDHPRSKSTTEPEIQKEKGENPESEEDEDSNGFKEDGHQGSEMEIEMTVEKSKFSATKEPPLPPVASSRLEKATKKAEDNVSAGDGEKKVNPSVSTVKRMKNMLDYMQRKQLPLMNDVPESEAVHEGKHGETLPLENSVQMDKPCQNHIAQGVHSFVACIPRPKERQIAAGQNKPEKAELAREEEAKRQTERRKRKEQMSQWKNTAQHKLHVPIKVVSKPDIEESRRPPEPSPNKKRKTEVKRKQKKQQIAQMRLQNPQVTPDPMFKPPGFPLAVPKSSPQYELTPPGLAAADTRSARKERRKNKRIPSWATGMALERAVMKNKDVDLETVFPRLTTFNPQQVFGNPDPMVIRDAIQRAYDYEHRDDSSVDWDDH